MNVRLVLEKGRARKIIRLKSAETIIGRRQDCDLRIASAEVSRRHCLLSIFNGYLNVQDLDSVNGTFLNGKRISNKEVVRPGDRLDVGPAHFVVEYELTPKTLEQLQKLNEGDEEALDVLPVDDEEGDALAVDVSDDLVEELAVAEADTDHIPLAQVADDEGPIPLTDDEAQQVSTFDLPPEGDLRNILVEMEDSQKKPKRRRG